MPTTRPSELAASRDGERGAAAWRRRLGRWLAGPAATLRCTVAALLAWVVTVAPLVLAARASLATRLAALAALGAGALGPQLIDRHHARARHVGISAFVALAALTWVMATRDGAWGPIDGFRAVLGGAAWAVFALSWSHPWSVSRTALRTAPEGRTGGLEPRRHPPRAAVVVALVGVAAAAACWGLAWRVDDPDRAVLAHALAAGGVVAIVGGAAEIAAHLGASSGRTVRAGRMLRDRRLWHVGLLWLVAALLLALVLATAR